MDLLSASGLNAPTACVLVPQPGIEPTSPALEGRFLTAGPAGKSLNLGLEIQRLSQTILMDPQCSHRDPYNKREAQWCDTWKRRKPWDKAGRRLMWPEAETCRQPPESE